MELSSYAGISTQTDLSISTHKVKYFHTHNTNTHTWLNTQVFYKHTHTHSYTLEIFPHTHTHAHSTNKHTPYIGCGSKRVEGNAVSLGAGSGMCEMWKGKREREIPGSMSVANGEAMEN